MVAVADVLNVNHRSFLDAVRGQQMGGNIVSYDTVFEISVATESYCHKILIQQ